MNLVAQCCHSYLGKVLAFTSQMETLARVPVQFAAQQSAWWVGGFVHQAAPLPGAIWCTLVQSAAVCMLHSIKFHQRWEFVKQ